jgi:hypothetical protein
MNIKSLKNLMIVVLLTFGSFWSAAATNNPVPNLDVTGGADLLITDVTLIPAVPVLNEAFEVSITVRNQGDTVTDSIVYRHVYVDVNPSTVLNEEGCPSVDTDFFRSDLNDQLDPGQSTTQSVDFPDGLGPGIHKIWIYTDATCINGEVNETNNAYGPITINLGGYDTGPTDVDISIAGISKGQYNVTENTVSQQNYSVSAGPVRLLADANTIVPTERVIHSFNGITTSYYEMMGLPAGQLSTEYWYPYNSNTGVNTQIRFGNVGASTAQVEVRIAGVLVGGPYSVAPNTIGAQNFYSVTGGPVQVRSTNGVPIISTQRFIFTTNGVTPSSFSETMGMPFTQLSNEYWFPFYNNVSLNSQIRIANVGVSDANVDVYVAGTQRGATYILPPNTTQFISLSGVSAGPVRIVSTNGMPIIATERVIHSFNGITTSYYEMMGMPLEQLSDEYWYPYNGNSGVNTQIRFANAGSSDAQVEVWIAGVLAGGPYTVAVNSVGAQNFYSNTGGPVQVRSTNGVPIISTERFIFTTNGVKPSSFSETMGMPLEQLSDEYWFPFYNNISLNSQIRFANP